MTKGRKKAIKLYQVPLFERILTILFFNGALIFLIWLVTPWSRSFASEYFFEGLIALIAVPIEAWYIYFVLFRCYIRFDIEKGKVTLREIPYENSNKLFPSAKKTEYNISFIKEMKFTRGNKKFKEISTIDILRYNGVSTKITSWREGNMVIFFTYNRQAKRIEKFLDKCNRALKEYHKTTEEE